MWNALNKFSEGKIRLLKKHGGEVINEYVLRASKQTNDIKMHIELYVLKPL